MQSKKITSVKYVMNSISTNYKITNVFNELLKPIYIDNEMLVNKQIGI